MYYDCYGKKIEIDKENWRYLNRGNWGSLVQKENTVLKEYFSTTPVNYRINLELFHILKTIKNKHFIQLYAIYSEMNLLELFLYKLKIKNFKIDAYTAKYYPDDSINVLYEHIDYLLDNLSELEKLFSIFTEERIVTKDVRRENMILGKTGIVIIDPDIFYKSTASKEWISLQNKKELLSAIQNVCNESLQSHPRFKELYSKIYTALTDVKVEETTDITYKIYQKLKSVKRPIDYLTQ